MSFEIKHFRLLLHLNESTLQIYTETIALKYKNLHYK
jgi:hypothetical protein